MVALWLSLAVVLALLTTLSFAFPSTFALVEVLARPVAGPPPLLDVGIQILARSGQG